MGVYVDELHCWPTKIKCFQGGSCHMVGDTAEELHALAEKIGLKREWFQNRRRLPHYDLTPAKRAAAIAAGAKEDFGLRDYVERTYGEK